MPPGDAELQAIIQDFLSSSRQPAVLEPGEEQMTLEDGNFALECRAGRLMFQVWDRQRNLVRRVTGVGERKPGRLELLVERFGKRTGRMYLLDLARGNRAVEERRGTRLVFREQFRRFLWRQFPDWKIAELSTEPNLHESLSPVYPRALLKKGNSAWAALAAPPEADAAPGALTFGLIWLDYLRRRERRLAIEGLVLFLAQGQEQPTSLRLPFLDPRAAQVRVYLYSGEGQEEWLDPSDYGNLDTRLEPCRTGCPERTAEVEAWIERLGALPHVKSVVKPDGAVSLCVRGLEFAQAGPNELRFGITARTTARSHNLPEIEALAAELARFRSPDADDRDHVLYRMHPEAWLESEVRIHLEQIDSTLLPSPVYGQVPAFAGGDRGVIDLLAADRSGRLAVLELKASEDIHLPLQALDYWMRVKWHLDRGEFSSLGYFPGLPLSPAPPRLLLIAPSLDYHPQTEVILRGFAPSIDVERIGLGVEWRQGPRIMFRMRGADRPV